MPVRTVGADPDVLGILGQSESPEADDVVERDHALMPGPGNPVRRWRDLVPVQSVAGCPYVVEVGKLAGLGFAQETLLAAYFDNLQSGSRLPGRSPPTCTFSVNGFLPACP
jgi:hypothetical protein